MKFRSLLLVALTAPLSAQAAAPAVSPHVQTGLRCAALFSIIAADQARQGARDWPPLAVRGREFFVRVSARAMDEGQLDRAALQARMQQEALGLRTAASQAAIKVPCLAMLDANIPPAASLKPQDR